jgi:transcriptional regulator with XRE-family HTH domain
MAAKYTTKKHTTAKYVFGVYLRNLRAEQGMSQDALCSGLCAKAQLSRIENGTRVPGKLLLNALLSRLGVAGDDYEYSLDCEEYRAWSKRQQILRAIMEDRIQDASGQVEAYQEEVEKNGEKQHLDRQFIHGIKAQIAAIEGQRKETICKEYETALNETVTGGWKKSLTDSVLSAQELNLYLEAAHYGDDSLRLDRYQEVMEYLDSAKTKWESLLLAQIYPKVVYYLYQEQKKCGKPETITWDSLTDQLKRINQAIERLRENQRTYYLWELLDARLDCLQAMRNHIGEDRKKQKTEAIDRLTEESNKWMAMIEELSHRYDVSLTMKNCAYLYTEKNIHQISDMIRGRRAMMGISMEKLADGICLPATIHRVEHGDRTHRYLLDQLQKRLGLPAEYCWYELISENPEVHRMDEMLRKYDNERQIEKGRTLLEKISKKIDMDLPVNFYGMKRHYLIYEMYTGELSQNGYEEENNQLLKEMLPCIESVGGKNVYMTMVERMTLHNIAAFNHIETERTQKSVRLLYDGCVAYEERNCIESYLNIFEMEMELVANRLGDWKRYNESNQISEIIIKENLLSHRVGQISNSIYNMLWNAEQTVEQQSDARADLQLCIVLSDFKKDEYNVRDYQERLLKREIANGTL